MGLIVAFSTEDGKKLINDHFGEGHLFPVYELDKDRVTYIKTVENTTGEEEMHGDSRKAQEISSLLKPHGVQVLCGRQFGPNIVRMVKKFLPVLVPVDTVDEALQLLKENYAIIQEEWSKGEQRKYLRLK